MPRKRSKKRGRPQISSGKNHSSPATESSSEAKNEEFDFTLRDFGPNCEFRQLLRTHHSPSESQLVEIRALESHLASEIARLDMLKLEKEADIERSENEITVISRQIRSVQRNFQRHSESQPALLPDGPSLYDLTLKMVNRTLELEKRIASDFDDIASIPIQREAVCIRKSFPSALLAPIRVLPPEIMGEIFLAYIMPDNRRRTGRSALLLCRLCSAWRSMAMSTPQLWSHLSVPRGLTYSSFADLAVSWYERARSLPISLSLVNTIHQSATAEQIWRHPEVDYIWPRITKLRIAMPYHSPPLLDMIFRSATAVQSLTLDVESDTGDFSAQFAKMRDLRRLTFICDPFFSSLSTASQFHLISRFPTGQLTHLSMSQFPTDCSEWRRVMRHCSGSLQCGSFTIYDAVSDIAITRYPTVVFRDLVSLQVRLGQKVERDLRSILPTQLVALLSPHSVYQPPATTQAAITRDIFCDFSFPCLRSLFINSDLLLISWNAPSLGPLQAPNLKTLTLKKFELEAQDLLEFIGDLPNLRLFTMDGLRTDYNFLIEHLSIPNNAKTFLPMLSSLSIRHMHLDNKKIDRSAVLRMIGARSSSPDEPTTPLTGRYLISISIDPSCF